MYLQDYVASKSDGKNGSDDGSRTSSGGGSSSRRRRNHTHTIGMDGQVVEYGHVPFMSIRSEDGGRGCTSNANFIIGMDGQVVRPDVLAPSCLISPSNGPTSMVSVDGNQNGFQDIINSDMPIRSETYVPPARHAMIGMDGSVVKLSDKASSNGSRRYDDAASRVSSSASSSHGQGNYDDWDDQDSQPRKLYRVPVHQDDIYATRKKRCLWALAVLVLALIILFMSVFVSRNSHEKRAIAAAEAQAGTCQPGVILKDTFEPRLRLIITGLSEYPTADEVGVLEQAIAEGYNHASGGCSDEFERFMYQVTMVNQTLESHLVLTDKTTRLENIFEETSVLTTDFHTKISCDGCSSEVAFASEYPSSFGILTSTKRSRNTDTGYRRDLALLERFLEDEPSSPVVSGSLNAGRIIDAMERSARQAIDGIEAFREVTILVTHSDGSSASTTLHKEVQQDGTEYSATFFRNKVVDEAQEFRDSNCYEGKKGGDDDDDDDGADSPTASPSSTNDENGICPASTRQYDFCLSSTECEMMAGGNRLACECYCCCEPFAPGSMEEDAELFTECVEDTCRGYCEETSDPVSAITCTYGGKKAFGGKGCDDSSGKKSGGKKSAAPSMAPSEYPSSAPSGTPSSSPSATPSASPSDVPSATPSASPSSAPSGTPSSSPSATPSASPSDAPSATPSASPSDAPSATPSASPSDAPSSSPSSAPSAAPSSSPSSSPSAAPSPEPSNACEIEVTIVTECGQAFRNAANENAVLVLESDLICTEDDQDGIRLLSDGITLDCQGNAIRLTEPPMSGDHGIIIGGNNIRVVNCEVTGWDFGIQTSDSPQNVYIENVISTMNSQGGNFRNVDMLTILNSNFDGNIGGADFGLRIIGDTEALLSGTSVSGNSNGGIRLDNNARLTLINSNVDGNAGGNEAISSDRSATEVVLQSSSVCGNSDGQIIGGIVTKVDSSCDDTVNSDCCRCGISGENPSLACVGFGVSSFEFTTSECNMMYTTSNSLIYLTGDVTCEFLTTGQSGIVIGASGVTVDCRGNQISGSSVTNTRGIRIQGDDVRVINCEITEFNTGIAVTGGFTGTYLQAVNVFGNTEEGFTSGSSISSTITRSRFENNRDGIRVGDGASVSVTSTTVDSNSVGGIRLGDGAMVDLYDVDVTRNGLPNGQGGIFTGSTDVPTVTIQRSTTCFNREGQGDISSRIPDSDITGTATLCDNREPAVCACPCPVIP
jgi:hypothetical protein